MKKFLSLIILISLALPCLSQEKSLFSMKLGVSADYSYSGSTNTIVMGPSLFLENAKDHESGYWHVFNVNAGLTWGKNTKSSAVTSAGYFFGNIPGVVFGISSQQYYGVETMYNNTRTDIRLSGEIVIALFGFLGYRYQHPLIINNEARYISRHSFIFRIPIPIKTITKK